MREHTKVADRHYRHLRRFLNTEDKELPSILAPIEEFNGDKGFTVGGCTESPLGGFHPVATRMVLRDDDYYLGYRADHFALVFGQSEALANDYGWSDCVVCLANHKGGLCITLFGFKGDMEVGGCET
jgi:hypothetical protein